MSAVAPVVRGKRDVRVYDYADLNVPMLSRMFDRRCRGYEALGYEIVVPASAMPGWPADVPLPVGPPLETRLRCECSSARPRRHRRAAGQSLRDGGSADSR